MGAAGLTCSSAEMAANGNLGISIDLDLSLEKIICLLINIYYLNHKRECYLS